MLTASHRRLQDSHTELRPRVSIAATVHAAWYYVWLQAPEAGLRMRLGPGILHGAVRRQDPTLPPVCPAPQLPFLVLRASTWAGRSLTRRPVHPRLKPGDSGSLITAASERTGRPLGPQGLPPFSRCRGQAGRLGELRAERLCRPGVGVVCTQAAGHAYCWKCRDLGCLGGEASELNFPTDEGRRKGGGAVGEEGRGGRTGKKEEEGRKERKKRRKKRGKRRRRAKQGGEQGARRDRP